MRFSLNNAWCAPAIIRLRKSLNTFATAFLLLSFLTSAPALFADEPPKPGTFTNPVIRYGADPWIVLWEGHYYLCQSYSGIVRVNKSARLQDIGQDNWTRVWSAPPDTPYSKRHWAPELHYLQGKWYIYVAASDGEPPNHRMFVLEGTSQDPQEPFVFKGKIETTPDRWAIDGTVLEMPDAKLYFLWSGWDGFENVAQNLYIAPMSNPWTISGERVLISRPEYDWEKRGEPLVNEGPQILWNRDKLFVIYSASGSWTDDYCLGQLTWTGGNLLDPKSWAKKPKPVFSKTDKVFGPGHCSFVKSRDGTEDWILYHAAKYSGAGWNRDIRMQRFTWNSDGSPNFGRPIPPGVSIREPSGDSAAMESEEILEAVVEPVP